MDFKRNFEVSPWKLEALTSNYAAQLSRLDLHM